MKLKIKNKRKFNRFIVITITIFTMITYSILAINSSNHAESKSSISESIIVKYGDTLWSIAEQVKSSRDIRDIVYDIQNINKLNSGNIRPGDKIYIPTY